MRSRKPASRSVTPLRRWMPLTLHWRRPAAKPAGTHATYNLTSHHSWQTPLQRVTRIVERPVLRLTTLLRESKEKTTHAFTHGAGELRLLGIERVTDRTRVLRSSRQSSTHTTASFVRQEQHVSTLREIARTFRTSVTHARRFGAPARETQRRRERGVASGFRLSSVAHESRPPREKSAEGKLLSSLRMPGPASWRAAPSLETRLPSMTGPGHVRRGETVSRPAAPSLVWRKRETAPAPVPPGETVEIRKHTVVSQSVQTSAAPASARAAPPLDRATMDRLAEDVISRIERRLRLERERRGR